MRLVVSMLMIRYWMLSASSSEPRTGICGGGAAPGTRQNPRADSRHILADDYALHCSDRNSQQRYTELSHRGIVPSRTETGGAHGVR